jgi:NADP-dependent 3-hydroxy acid dehydrogenase YdfG
MSKHSQVIYRGSYALITGASKGIGKVFAEVLASRGMNVVLVARSKDSLTALAGRLSEKYGTASKAALPRRTLRRDSVYHLPGWTGARVSTG